MLQDRSELVRHGRAGKEKNFAVQRSAYRTSSKVVLSVMEYRITKASPADGMKILMIKDANSARIHIVLSPSASHRD